MAAPDGSIIVDTKIRTDGMEAGSREIENSLVGIKDSMKFALQSIKDFPKIAKIAFSSASSAIRGVITGTKDLSTQTQDAAEKQSQAAQKASAALAEQEKKVNALRQKMIEYGNAKIPTQEYMQAEKEIEKLSQKLKIAEDRKRKFVASGGQITELTKEYKAASQEVESLSQKLEAAKEKRRVIETEGRSTELTKEYKTASQEVDRLEKALLRAYDRREALEKGGKKGGSAFQNLERSIEQLEHKLQMAEADKARLESESSQKTKPFKAIENEIESLERKLQEAEQKKAQLESESVQKTKPFKAIEYDIERLREQLEEAVIKKSQLEQSGRGHVSGIDTEEFAKLSQEYQLAAQKLEELRQKEAEAAEESRRLAEIGKNAKVSNPHVIKLRAEIERLTERQKLLERAGVGGLGFQEWERNAQRIQRLNAALKRYQNGAEKAKKSTKKLNKEIRNTSKSNKKSSDSFLSHFKTILKYTVGIRSMYILFNRLRSGLKEGLENLAQYSDDTNQAISLLMSRMTQLKNAFATAFSPLIEVAAPYLARFISLLAEAATWTSQLFSALMGKDTFTKASQVQQDYTDSLDKSKDSTEELKKATEKALAPFDEIIQLQKAQSKTDKDKDKTELKPEQMFETVQVSNQMKVMAEDIKKTFDGLFNPIKKSWEDNGPAVLESMKNVFASAKKLASDVGASFMQVWNVEGYGKKITDDLLITFANLAQTVANLITQFDKAWNSGNTGTNILRHLGDIILEITGFFRQASESLKNWAADLDFSPLLMAFDRVLVAIKPIVADVGNAILWLLDNVLLPVTKWGIEQALPEVFNLIAAALKVFHSVIQALKPLALWLWESYLKPFGEWSGKVIISALKKITELLTKFSDWIRENQEIIQGVTILVLEFFAAWKTIQLLSFIQQSGGVIEALKRITTAIMGSTLAKTKDIAETAILNAMYAKDFVVSMGKAAAAILKANANFILFTASITAIIGLIVVLAKNWNKMSPTEKVISSILAAAAAVGVLAVALGAVKGAAGAALVAAALAAGIAAATIAINAGKRQVSSYQSAGRSMSGREYAPAAAYMAVPYRMPRLATGTVVPPRAGEFAAILGDNKRETEVVSPLSTMKQALLEALQEAGIGGENKTAGPIYMEIDGKVFARMINPYMESEKSRIGVRMVNT